MRLGLVVLWMLLFSAAPAAAQVSVGIGFPGVSIGINLPAYPQLVRVPGYPVYYAPSLNSNFFFYDGMYWVYQGDNWYASSWYNGPWGLVAPAVVPLYVLRVPVRYYRQPPVYFGGGGPMRRRAGASTGAMNGSSATAVGPVEPQFGTGPRPVAFLPAAVCRQSVSGRRSNSMCCVARTTATSRATS